jgi:hypothetical protein
MQGPQVLATDERLRQKCSTIAGKLRASIAAALREEARQLTGAAAASPSHARARAEEPGRRVPRTMAALPSRAALPSPRSRMVHVSSCRLVCGSIQRTLELQRVPACPERMRCERQQEHSRSKFCRYQVALARIAEVYHVAIIDIMNHLNLAFVATRMKPHWQRPPSASLLVDSI